MSVHVAKSLQVIFVFSDILCVPAIAQARMHTTRLHLAVTHALSSDNRRHTAALAGLRLIAAARPMAPSLMSNVSMSIIPVSVLVVVSDTP